MNFVTVDTHKVEELLRQVAQEQILPHYQTLSEGQIKEKTDAELIIDGTPPVMQLS